MNNENKNSAKETTFTDIRQIFLNNIFLFIITVLIAFLISYVYAFYVVTPDYKSNADVMVQVEQDTTASDQSFDLVNAFRLIDTIAELMEKEIVLINAIERLEEFGYEDLDLTYLKEGLSIDSSNTSYFINISFVDENKLLAKNVVDAVIDAVIEVTDVENAFPVLTNKIRRTSFASDSIYNSPNKFLIITLGIIFGIITISTFLVSKEILSSNYRNKDEIEDDLNLPVLGIIPLQKVKGKTNEKKN